MRGPTPTPTPIKILSGNPSKRAINRNEPIPDRLDEAVPDELQDDAAIAEWRRTIVPAIRVGIVTAADRTIAIAHANYYAAWVTLFQRAIGRGGLDVDLLREAHKTMTLLVRIDSEMGLTPAGRTRVKVAAVSASSEDSELDRILSIK